MLRIAVLLFLFEEECITEGPFDPPDAPAHDRNLGGAMHARGDARPFLCDGEACPTGRPADDLLSCDASGCHGTFTFDGDNTADRQLHGSDGPSCWTCHGRVWAERVQ